MYARDSTVMGGIGRSLFIFSSFLKVKLAVTLSHTQRWGLASIIVLKIIYYYNYDYGDDYDDNRDQSGNCDDCDAQSQGGLLAVPFSRERGTSLPGPAGQPHSSPISLVLTFTLQWVQKSKKQNYFVSSVTRRSGSDASHSLTEWVRGCSHIMSAKFGHF